MHEFRGHLTQFASVLGEIRKVSPGKNFIVLPPATILSDKSHPCNRCFPGLTGAVMGVPGITCSLRSSGGGEEKAAYVLNPIRRQGRGAGDIRRRMASKRVWMPSSWLSIFRSSSRSLTASSRWATRVFRRRTKARMIATLTRIAR